MIRFAGYGVIVEKPRVGHLPRIFPEKLCARSNNDCHLFNRLDVIYYHAKLGEDRTTHAGCRCENMVFVFFCHAPRPVRCLFEVYTLNRYCVAVYGGF